MERDGVTDPESFATGARAAGHGPRVLVENRTTGGRAGRGHFGVDPVDELPVRPEDYLAPRR